ncbi:MAG: methyl-accepting chemotaxis protein, partial [Aestuariivirga sp.]
AGVFLLPILLLGWLFGSQLIGDIAALRSELQGVKYVEKLWSGFVDVAGQRSDIEAVDMGATKGLEESVATGDNGFGIFDEITKFKQAWKIGSSASDTLLLADASINKISDQSGIVLDSELESLYLALATTKALPSLVEAAHDANRDVQAIGRSVQLYPKQVAEFNRTLGKFNSAIEPVISEFARSFEAGSNGVTKANLQPSLIHFQNSAKQFQTEMQGLAELFNLGITNKFDPARAESAYKKLLSDSDVIWKLGSKNLERALGERLARQSARAYLWLTLVLLALGVATGLMYFVANTIRRPVAEIVSQLDRMRNGDTNFSTDYLDDTNEVGEISRGLERFKDTLKDLAVERQRREKAQAEEALRTKEMTELAVVINTVVDAAKEGDFSKRVPETSKQEVMTKLSRGVNELAQTVELGLNQTVSVISALASGDLTKRVNGEFKGTFLRLKNDTNTMAEKFRDIARRISGASTTVHESTREIAAGVNDLSLRTESQASSLEETSAAMEEMAATVRHNATNAKDASKLAAQNSAVALAGNQVVSKAVDAMTMIEGSSKKIGDIVGLIQEISFQTNILSLNAAVEAARAGDAGRGFAVVANEVRALAQRAAMASKDIKNLIATSNGQVSQGVALVRQAGNSLNEIMSAASKVESFVGEIAASSHEQSIGIEQVSSAISEMDQATQRNAALVQETNAALHLARAQADELQDAISFFQLDEIDVTYHAEPTPMMTQAGRLGAGQFRLLSTRMAERVRVN